MLLHPGSRPVPNTPDYILVRKLGAGAFGEVWHAHGPGGLDVALNFIRLDNHVRAVELRSLDVMKSIRHPNLVSLFGAWHQDNWLILAMELCDRSLQDRLAEALDQKLPGIPLKELLSFMSDAANGLDALNAKQVQHRDVKPANLLLLASGVKVADFGLAKALEQTVGSNSGAGTLAYTAPECFKGQLAQQSDQYSLAVTYYHLRTGHPLFKGDQAQVMYAHLELEPDLSRVPARERVVLSRALSKEPGTRWPNCNAFVDELINAHRKAKEIPGIEYALFYYNCGSARLDEAGLEEKHCDTPITDFDEAIRLFDNAIRFEPENALAYLHRGRVWLARYCACRIREGDEGCDVRDFDKGIKDLDEAIRLDPFCVSAYVDRGEAWTFKDEAKAIKDFERAIHLDPQNALFYYNRGRAWSRKQNPDKAIKDFDDAIRLDPNNAFYYYNRGNAWRAKKDYDKQIMDFGEAIRLEPDNAFYFRCRGDAWMAKKDYEKAIKDFDDAIRLDPEHGFFYHLRGEVSCLNRDFDKAIRDFDQAIRCSPDFSCPYASLAWLLATSSDKKVRDGKRAIQLATKACDLSGSDSGFYLDVLAAAHAEAGQFDEAVRFQTKALEDRRQRPNWDNFRQRLELYKQKKPYRA